MTVLDWYREPLFWLFPVGSIVVSIVAFIAFAGPLTWLAAKDPAWARPYRLQSRPPREQQLLGASFRWWLLNDLVFGAAVERRLVRSSGLRDALWGARAAGVR